MGIERTEDDSEVAYARSITCIAARAAEVLALDTPYFGFRNPEGLRQNALASKKMGFKGKFAIHPAQIDMIHEIFSPLPAEIDHARRVVAAFEEAARLGRGSTSLDGKVVDVPVVKRARALLEVVERSDSHRNPSSNPTPASRMRVRHGARLLNRLLRTARRPHSSLEGPGEVQQLVVRLVQVNGLSQGLTDLVGRCVVQLDAVILGVVEVDTTGNAMGDRAVNPQALVLEPMIKRPHVIQALHLERNLLHVLGFLCRVFGPGKGQLMVLGLRVGAEKADTPL
jgi:hypothetical protein